MINLLRRSLPWVMASTVLLLVALPASAHHLMEFLGTTTPTPLTGFLSGLGHPLLGPDHLLFVLALGLVGLHRPLRWVFGLLATGLVASGVGLLWPGLPGAECLVALSLVVVGLVLTGRLPQAMLLPSFALHGYVLSASVLGWEPTPIAWYLLGLLVSQGLLLSAAVQGVRRFSQELSVANLRLLAGLVMGVGLAFAWTSVVP